MKTPLTFWSDRGNRPLEGNSVLAPGLIIPDAFRYWRHPRQRAAFEATIWIVGLLGVGLADPTQPSVIELCVFKALGFSGGPGCGLGHAMGFLFRAEWSLAIQSHWLSPFVLVVLLSRIGSLMREAITAK